VDEAELRQWVRDAVQSLGGLRASGRLWGIAHQDIAHFLTGNRPPSKKLLRILGFRKEISVTYVSE
jgi:hypothetical protein